LKLKWRHLAQLVTNDNSLCSFYISETALNTPKTTNSYPRINILTFCMSTVHALDVSAVLSHYKLHIITPFADSLVDKRQFLPCIDDCSFQIVWCGETTLVVGLSAKWHPR